MCKQTHKIIERMGMKIYILRASDEKLSMGFFEQHLIIWIAQCMVVGALILCGVIGVCLIRACQETLCDFFCNCE